MYFQSIYFCWGSCKDLLPQWTNYHECIAFLPQEPRAMLRPMYCKSCTCLDIVNLLKHLHMWSISAFLSFKSCRCCYLCSWDDKWSSSYKCMQCFMHSAVAKFCCPQDSAFYISHVFMAVSVCPDVASTNSYVLKMNSSSNMIKITVIFYIFRRQTKSFSSWLTTLISRTAYTEQSVILMMLLHFCYLKKKRIV